MNAEKLMEYLGGIDDEYVREAAPGKRLAKRSRWRLGGLAAAVLILAAAVSAWAAGIPAPWAAPDISGPGLSATEKPAASGAVEPGPECVPGYIRWHGANYFACGNAAEMPEGLELLGEVNQVVPDGKLIPEDAGDLSANIEGYAYWFPGNENLIVFRYKDWDTSYAAVELGRQEPFLLMLRDRSEEELRAAGYLYCSLSELVEDSYAIVEGTQVRLEQSGGGPDGSGVDVYTVQVTSLLKGSVGAQETIRVTVPADSGLLEDSGEGSYLLFLRGNGDLTYRPVSAKQGVYPIVHKSLCVPLDDPCMRGIILAPYTHSRVNMFWVRQEVEAGKPMVQ